MCAGFLRGAGSLDVAAAGVCGAGAGAGTGTGTGTGTGAVAVAAVAAVVVGARGAATSGNPDERAALRGELADEGAGRGTDTGMGTGAASGWIGAGLARPAEVDAVTTGAEGSASTVGPSSGAFAVATSRPGPVE